MEREKPREPVEQKCNPVPAGQTACLCALLSKACPVSRMALPPKCHVGLQLSAQPVRVGCSLIIPVSVLSFAVAAGLLCLCPALGTPGTAPCPGPRARGSAGRKSPEGTAGQCWLRALSGALARYLQPCAHAIPHARSAVPIKKKGRDEDCCY